MHALIRPALVFEQNFMKLQQAVAKIDQALSCRVRGGIKKRHPFPQGIRTKPLLRAKELGGKAQTAPEVLRMPSPRAGLQKCLRLEMKSSASALSRFRPPRCRRKAEHQRFVCRPAVV